MEKSKIPQIEQTQVLLQVNAKFLYRKVPGATRLILLLHGYAENSERIYSRLIDTLPQDVSVLSLEAPFPVVTKKDDGYRLGYSWYFYDPKTDEYLIDPTGPTQFVVDVVKALHLDKMRIGMIGFSQGGYLAPFIAQKLKNVHQVIGIACEILIKELSSDFHFRVDQIHGDQDEVVNASNAQEAHLELRRKGVEGEFLLLPGVGHKITKEVQERLQKCLAES